MSDDIPGARSWSPTPLVRASAGLHSAALLGLAFDPAAWPWLAGAVAADHALLAAIGMYPRSAWLGSNLVRLPRAAGERRQVALTFDDGPNPAVTPAVLDILDRYGAGASFFCVGRRAASHPAIVREIVRRGHAVENHTDRHLNLFACLPRGALAREIGAAQARLADIAGSPPRFFRPPMGIRSPLLDPVLARLGLRHVSWTRRGYDATSRDVRAVLRRLTQGLAARDVLMLHDGGPGCQGTRRPVVLDVLPALLDRLAREALCAVSLSVGTAELEPWPSTALQGYD